MLINSFECLNGQGIKTRANGKLLWWRTAVVHFWMPQSQLKWKSCAIALVINRNSVNFKKSVHQSQHRRVNLSMNVWKFCHKDVVTYPRAFLSGYPWPLLVGIRCIAEPDFTKYDVFLGQHLCWPWNNIVINQSDLKNKFIIFLKFRLTISVCCLYISVINL